MNKHVGQAGRPDLIAAGHLMSWQRLVLWRVREDRCAQVAGSLTFTTLLALVPLVTVALAVAAAG